MIFSATKRRLIDKIKRERVDRLIDYLWKKSFEEEREAELEVRSQVLKSNLKNESETVSQLLSSKFYSLLL